MAIRKLEGHVRGWDWGAVVCCSHQNCRIYTVPHNIVQCIVQWKYKYRTSTVQVQYSTVQYSTIQYNTVQYSTIKYITI